jgi:hypothetical protein
MKRFRFRLERALAWRRTQSQLEESKLERLYAELRSLSARSETLARERDQAGRELLKSGAATGVELTFLDSFRGAADAELARLAAEGAQTRRKIATQISAVTARRRDVRILENLRDRQFATWRAGFERWIDQQASESHRHRRNAGDRLKRVPA